MKKLLLTGIGFAWMLCALAGCLKNLSAAPPQKPNILFIVVDDLRPQLGCYGRSQMITPGIDRLAAEGLLFQRAFCQVPVCGASRASLLTGLRPTPQRFINFMSWAEKDAPGIATLPEHFKNNGYTTISNGKVFHHNPDCLSAWSEEPWRPQSSAAGKGYFHEDNRQLAAKDKQGHAAAYEISTADETLHDDYLTASKTIDDLRKLKQADQPFFLAAGFLKPHLPFVAPKKYWDLYDPGKLPLADNPLPPKDAPKIALTNWAELRLYHGIPKQGPCDDDLARTLVHGYYACTTFIDAQVGRLLDELDRLDLAKNTIVILWGDHGWQLGEHGMWCKHCNFNTSLNAPLIIKTPGHAPKQKTSALVEFVDIYPSLCELADLPLPGHLQGTSFVPLLSNPDRPWKSAAFSRYRQGDSIRTDRYLYTEYTQDGKLLGRMLYDHQADPDENINIAELPENKERVENLSEQLRAGFQPVQKEIRSDPSQKPH